MVFDLLGATRGSHWSLAAYRCRPPLASPVQRASYPVARSDPSVWRSAPVTAGPRLKPVIEQRELEVIEREGRRIIELGRNAPDAVVPQYPTWTMADLVTHIGSVHGRTADVCERLPAGQIPATQPPNGADACDWAASELERMLSGLAGADPEADVWTFGPSPRLAFWSTRMVVETGVHRWDAEGAAGRPEPLLEVVATSGLDEFADLYLPRLGDLPTIELHAPALDRWWRYGDGEPEATVAGSASDLFLRLMSRPGVALPHAWEQAVDALGSPADQ